MTHMIRSLKELTAEQQPLAGGKGGTLARLYQAGYPVPDGFVILPTAFEGDELKPEAWAQVQAHLKRLRRGDPDAAFAVRSSAMSEDAALASFAGEFETVLDIHSDEMLREAIRTVRRSRRSERVRAYSEAKGLDTAHEIAVVVQRLVRAGISGVLFTADPVSGSRTMMTGNYVYGLGDELVSGEVEPYTFALERPKGRYDGPPELKRYARKLYKLGRRLERDLGSPQDIEWAVAGDRLYLLQSRPITTLVGYDPTTGDWNDSLTGDYLWSSANVSEALPDVMTPLTWSLWQVFHVDTLPIHIPGEHPFAGNICSRCYVNFSLLYSICRLGMNTQKALHKTEEVLGRVPEGVDVPLIPFSRSALVSLFLSNLPWERKFRRLVREIPDFVATAPGWCRQMREQLQGIQAKAELVSLWCEELKPYLYRAFWVLRAGMKLFTDQAIPLDRKLTNLVGTADANALLSNLSGNGELASLGPVVGVARVAHGEMSRATYLELYGHRGPHEAELSIPCPADEPGWLNRQLEAFHKSPVDVDALLAKQRTAFDAAWERFRERYPHKAKAMSRRLEQTAEAARTREAVRSETMRVVGVVRAFALRAGELTGLGDGVFFLTLDELLDVLSGDESATAYIPARKETYNKYCALPPYPTIIRGRFDPFEWAADPNRRSDVYDAHAPVSMPASEVIEGFPGAAGRVEGRVRRLGSPEEGDQLQPGEILVAVTTNVGWTPLFPRAAAIVTDVGAPLSHAAIVARELGIPAVVGCGDATMRLKTGDRVRVNGGRGVVEILEQA